MRTKRTARRNSVVVQFGVPRRGLPSAASFRRWAAFLPMEVTLRFVRRGRRPRLNRHYRKKPYPTNGPVVPVPERTAATWCCWPSRVAREARAQGKCWPGITRHLVLHGLLHLAGLRA
jgi:probable rRNA maturation factor